MKLNAKSISYIILLVSTIFGLFLVSNLFAEGTPLNIDLPTHYSRLQCWEATGSWNLVSSWCPWFNAGLPYFQGYGILPFQLSVILSIIFSMEISFKIVLTLIYFILPISAFLLLNTFKQPLAGSIAYALLLFEGGSWHMGGFEQIFLVGMFAQAFGTGLLFFNMYFIFRFFENTGNKNLVLLSIATTLLLLTHPIPFVLLMMYLVIFAIFYRKEVMKNYKKVLLYPVTVFFLSGFWFLPMITRRNYYQNILGGIQINMNDFIAYFYAPINKFLLILGIIGLIIFFLSKKNHIKKLAIIALVVPVIIFMALNMPSLYKLLPFSNVIRELRLVADLRVFTIIFASLLLGLIAKLKFNFNKKKLPVGLILSILIFLFLLSAVYPSTKQKSQSILTSNLEDVRFLDAMYDAIPRGGRILQEQTLYRLGNTPLSFTHAEALGPYLANREFVISNNALLKEDYITDYLYGFIESQGKTTEELANFFKRTNIKYIIFSQGSQDVAKLQELLKDFNLSQTIVPFLVYDTLITPSNFEIENGEVQELAYTGLYAKAQTNAPTSTRLLFKVHDYPNWKITVDNLPAERLNDPGYLMEIKVPAGKHTIEFKYKTIAFDYISYLFTIIGIIGCVYLWRKKSH